MLPVHEKSIKSGVLTLTLRLFRRVLKMAGTSVSGGVQCQLAGCLVRPSGSQGPCHQTGQVGQMNKRGGVRKKAKMKDFRWEVSK